MDHIDLAMHDLKIVRDELDKKDARIKELEEEVGRLTAERNDSVIEAIVRKETYICS